MTNVPLQAVARWVRACWQPLEEIVYPRFCLQCDVPLAGNAYFCTACRDTLAASGRPACRRCGAFAGPFVDTSGGCVECRSLDLRFDSLVRAGPYEGPLRDMCLALKKCRNEYLGTALAALLFDVHGEALAGRSFDLVAAVPLHWTRRFRRGFNQAESLARYLAGVLKVPARCRILRRVRNTPPQARLGKTERFDNVRGVFSVRRHVRLDGKCVLLVDDILTTGATCSEAARALKAAGAAHVHAAVVARA